MRTIDKRRRTAALAALSLAATGQALAGVTVTVTPERQSLERSDEVTVTVTLANTATTTAWLLRSSCRRCTTCRSRAPTARAPGLTFNGCSNARQALQAAQAMAADAGAYLQRKAPAARYGSWCGPQDDACAATVGKIHVGQAFWDAPLTGTDSKGGTLVHETSHFRVVAGTRYWVYGQAGAAQLAKEAPERTAGNADSHEYFGENQPHKDVR
jgi:peptidyl-Lys metalloendopeptidase